MQSCEKFCTFSRSEASGTSTPPLEMKMDKKEVEEPEVNGIPEKEDEPPSVDIMAQQLKFVACLKILMEELSTLATGFEVDGKFLMTLPVSFL